MIDIKRYNDLKEEYGHVSSWTIWEQPTDGIKSNIGDVDFFEDDNICTKLNDKYVFVGLNGSDTHKNSEVKPWKNFHSSDKKRQQDYKLRHALTGTKFWGSYITDIIKEIEDDPEKAKDKNSQKFMSKLRKKPEEINKNIEMFKHELSLLTDEKPVIIAIGNDSYNILKNNLPENEYKCIRKILHYAYRIGPEKYKTRVNDVLKDI